MPMQDGDVPATWADTSLLEEITSYKPKTNIKDGVNNFIAWYKEFYKV
jgi:UDP-glucuronate 4-epimerase